MRLCDSQRGSVTLVETAIAATLAFALLLAVADLRIFVRRADSYDRCVVQANPAELASPDFDRSRCS
jgi:hypothetical protein